MITTEQKNRAHQDADYIFKELFPQCGMKERQGQTSLCHEMLDAMFGAKIMLSDAGTGIGKTYAYLTAAVIFHKYRMEAGESWQPIAISTASVALQEAIHREYIPFLSKLLIRAGYLTRPMESVIRKGKSRYVCDERLIKRLNAVNLQKKNRKNAEALLSLRSCLDMDQAKHLSGYDRRQVAVPRICDCDRYCRYKRFLEDAASGKYLFQICNHNLLLADAMNTSLHRHPILRPYYALIVDEAHKLPSAARQMFGRTLGQEDVLALCHGLKAEHELLLQAILESHRELNTGLLEKNSSSPFPLPTPPSLKLLEDRLHRQLHQRDADVQDTLSLIREWAAEKYEALKDEAADHTERLAAILEAASLKEYDDALTERIVRNIILAETGAITVRYINGMEIMTGKESGNEPTGKECDPDTGEKGKDRKGPHP